jgi:hypothetical protein
MRRELSMGNDPRSDEERLAELRQSGEAIGQLAEDPGAFNRAVEAFRAQDAERFRGELGKLGLLEGCRFICRWLCSKHCVFVCLRLCGPFEQQPELDVDEWLQFAQLTAAISRDDELLRALVGAVDGENAAAWRELIARLQADRFCHQLCHWLCSVRCRLVCKLMCPPPPMITEVAYIPTTQIDVEGRAAGPSLPPGMTPPDSKAPGGVGDHPFGGKANIRGAFVVPGATHYKVEFGPSSTGPWTAITPGIADFRFNPAWLSDPSQPFYLYYTRVADPTDHFYTIADMGLAGADYLTDWQTPAGPDDLYYLKLTVRTPLGLSDSPVVPARVDNEHPKGPVMPGERPRITLRQGDRELDCCETVKEKDGPITINIEATDPNFSALSVDLYGGCGVSANIFSKTYDGDITDTGAPAPGIDISWNPWAAGISRCCYVIFFRIWDRVIADNFWSGGHENENWHSITIA